MNFFPCYFLWMKLFLIPQILLILILRFWPSENICSVCDVVSRNEIIEYHFNFATVFFKKKKNSQLTAQIIRPPADCYAFFRTNLSIGSDYITETCAVSHWCTRTCWLHTHLRKWLGIHLKKVRKTVKKSLRDKQIYISQLVCL